MKTLRLLVVGVLLVAPSVAQAQVSGVALAAFSQGNVFDGFVGPFKVTPAGVAMNFAVLCYAPVTREKATPEAVANIPDGSTLSDMRTLITTAVVQACSKSNITVPRAAVFLPVLQAGL